MATDYDAPRKRDEDTPEDSIEELKSRRKESEELSVRVIHKQDDEFTCAECFMVHHRSQLASEENGVMICADCAGLS